MLSRRLGNPTKYVRCYSEICSALYVPGNQDKMLKKSLQFSPSVVVPDMEDSVPPAQKPEARKMISRKN
jgi:citrate lyase subunit beta / citryl-CoA lyase